jgi:transposase
MSIPLPQTIGIDISKAALDCHAYPAGIEARFANTAKGHKALMAWLGQWPIERIAYEATATYHRALEAALADWPCVKLNPERARRFAQATGTLAKTDRIDAMLLARMAATLQPPIRPARSANQILLAELINARDGLAGARSHRTQEPGKEPHHRDPQTPVQTAPRPDRAPHRSARRRNRRTHRH